jgi:hypothetical protein
MSHHWSFLSVCLTLFLLQISSLHSTPINSDTTSPIIHENDNNQHTPTALLYLINNFLDESNPYEQAVLLNQIREYLNRMCTVGYFGSSRAHACKHIADIVHQFDENKIPFSNDESNNEHHGLQKRFFCNGFIGCKSSGR